MRLLFYAALHHRARASYLCNGGFYNCPALSRSITVPRESRVSRALGRASALRQFGSVACWIV